MLTSLPQPYLKQPRLYAVREADSDGLTPLVAIQILKGFDARAAGTLQGHQAAALALLYECYAPMLRRVAAQILGAPAEAEDVLHDVFAKLPWIISQHSGGAFGGWIRQIVARTALMRLRSSKKICYVAEIPDVTVSECTASWDDAELLSQLISDLPIALREVVLLRFFLEFSHEEIGEALSISANASEVRLCRALKHLRLKLYSLAAT